MIATPETAFLVVGLMTAGTGLIFLLNDRANPASRALSACLMAIGLRLFLSGNDTLAPHIEVTLGLWLIDALTTTLESLAILCGLEWGLRIGRTGPPGRLRLTSTALFRAAQILIIVYWGLSLGYLAIFPEQAMSDVAGNVRVRGVEFAVFAPVLGTSILLAGIAITTLRFSRIDRAEIVRLRALAIAGPFLLGGLIFGNHIVPITLTLGLLAFLAGSVRYLLIQNQRGQFMRQFLSPEVARLVQQEGMDEALKRQRRVLSVVICDLRGFTDYARQHDSDAVVGLLERFYNSVGEVAARHGGTVKDHAGDGVLILVGAPLAMPDHTTRALQLADDLRQVGIALLAGSTPELGLGVGVATGRTTIGAIRGARRLEYVAVGSAVNLAARLCDRARAGEVLCDQRTLQGLDAATSLRAEPRQAESLKGFPEPVAVFAVAPRAASAPAQPT